MKSILFVDDEAAILNLLKRLFFDMDYSIFTAENGEAALAIMENEHIDLVASDIRMPGMDGYQLLQRIKERYPKVLRVIISGYADEKMVIRALLKNIAKIYLFKPWKNEALLELIEHLFKTEDLFIDSKFQAIMDNAEELPTIKSSYRKILDLTETDAGITEIVGAIEQDQSIASKLLHIANTAFYGVRTASVAQAVKYLGFATVRNLVLSTPIMDSLDVKGTGSNFVEKQWNHAFLTNKILIMIYKKYLRRSLTEAEGTAGLLHNIGVMFFIKRDKREYLRLTRFTADKDMAEMERENLGLTHAEAGGYLLHWWELPYPIVECALYHHTPFDERVINRELVMAVHLAQKYATDMLGLPEQDAFFPEVFSVLGIEKENMESSLAGISKSNY